jgi:hypothetical protein
MAEVVVDNPPVIDNDFTKANDENFIKKLKDYYDKLNFGNDKQIIEIFIENIEFFNKISLKIYTYNYFVLNNYDNYTYDTYDTDDNNLINLYKSKNEKINELLKCQIKNYNKFLKKQDQDQDITLDKIDKYYDKDDLYFINKLTKMLFFDFYRILYESPILEENIYCYIESDEVNNNQSNNKTNIILKAYIDKDKIDKDKIDKDYSYITILKGSKILYYNDNIYIPTGTSIIKHNDNDKQYIFKNNIFEIKNQSILDDWDKNLYRDIIVDAAGLEYMQSRSNLSNARGISGEIYKDIGIWSNVHSPTFKGNINEDFVYFDNYTNATLYDDTSNLRNKIPASRISWYGLKVVIHAVGPDFRNNKDYNIDFNDNNDDKYKLNYLFFNVYFNIYYRYNELYITDDDYHLRLLPISASIFIDKDHNKKKKLFESLKLNYLILNSLFNFKNLPIIYLYGNEPDLMEEIRNKFENENKDNIDKYIKKQTDKTEIQENFINYNLKKTYDIDYSIFQKTINNKCEKKLNFIWQANSCYLNSFLFLLFNKKNKIIENILKNPKNTNDEIKNKKYDMIKNILIKIYYKIITNNSDSNLELLNQLRINLSFAFDKKYKSDIMDPNDLINDLGYIFDFELLSYNDVDNNEIKFNIYLNIYLHEDKSNGTININENYEIEFLSHIDNKTIKLKDTNYSPFLYLNYANFAISTETPNFNIVIKCEYINLKYKKLYLNGIIVYKNGHYYVIYKCNDLWYLYDDTNNNTRDGLVEREEATVDIKIIGDINKVNEYIQDSNKYENHKHKIVGLYYL